jgi:class 3 adenylate cyclase
MMIHQMHAPRAVWRSIVAVDIEGSTNRTDTVKALLRCALYDLLERALSVTELTARHAPPIDRGDGVLILIRPVAPPVAVSAVGTGRVGSGGAATQPSAGAVEVALVETVVPRLAALLGHHNSSRPGESFRLRAVVHSGEVCYDRRGYFGETLDVAFRLLDAVQVKRALRRTDAPLVLVTSDPVYQSVRWRSGYRQNDMRTTGGTHDADGIGGGPGEIEGSSFEPLASLHIGERRYHGWVRALELAGTTSDVRYLQ